MDLALRRWAWLALALACAPGARAGGAPAALYRLPYPEGQAYTITQAPGGILTSHATKAGLHAVDFAMPEATPVLAARGGTVIAAEWRNVARGRGADDWYRANMVRVRHADGTIATYAHLQHYGVAVEEGEFVAAGKMLGYSGSTGYASGPHLHFAVTRVEGSAGGAAEVSVPVMFWNGDPPAAFAPRVGLTLTARYARTGAPEAAAAAPPPAARADAERPLPPPEVLAAGFARLAVLCVLLLAGMVWFYRFPRG
jgi:murein DD-endopeptidase MepM/ murein hydrolase activator NlpD